MKLFEKIKTDKERAFYGIAGAMIRGCTFAGDADGESAIKECRDLQIEGCDFYLRYPMWHLSASAVNGCRLYETCRAPLWYCADLHMKSTEIRGVKAFRECKNTEITDCDIESTELGWFCTDMCIKNTRLVSEYPFLKAQGLVLDNVDFKGKYSFQYIENAEIKNCTLDTKDAFWHAKNVTVSDSEVKGEYLGWYSENLTFIRCKISGTQPLCYCKNLTLIDCTMDGCDLSFERSEVKCAVTGAIESVKNPILGSIEADGIGQVIMDIPSSCEIKIR